MPIPTPQFKALLSGAAAIAIAVAAQDFTANPSLPAWLDVSGIVGQRMLYDSTGKLTYAPNNLLTYSNTFSNAAWTAVASSTITQNQPDQSGAPNTAWSAVPSAGTSTFYWYQNTPAAGTYQFSIVAKAIGYNFLWIYVGNGANALIYFNLSNGTVGTASGSSTNKQGTIRNLGNGYYRCTVYTTAAGSTTTGFGVSSVDGNNTLVANGTSGIIVAYAALSLVTYETSPRPADQVITTSAAYYGPRFDYDPATVAAKGLLIEESRTNQNKSSADIAGTGWTAGAGVTIGAATTAPDGTNSAKLYQSTDANDFLYNTAAVAIAAPFTSSIYLKYGGTGRWLLLTSYGTSGHQFWFDLLNGVAGSSASYSGTPTLISPTITNVGNGWYRIAWGCATGATHNYLQINSVAADLSTVQANGSAYVWGAQSEAGLFPTSYIPTTSAAVTRVADVVKLSGAALAALQSGVASALVEVGNIGQAVNPNLLTYGVNSLIYAHGTNPWNSSSYQGVLLDGTPITNIQSAINRFGVSFDASGRTNLANNTAGASDANAFSIGANPVHLGSGNGGTSGFIGGYVRGLSVYNSRLSSAVLQAKSTVGGPL